MTTLLPASELRAALQSLTFTLVCGRPLSGPGCVDWVALKGEMAQIGTEALPGHVHPKSVQRLRSPKSMPAAPGRGRVFRRGLGFYDVLLHVNLPLVQVHGTGTAVGGGRLWSRDPSRPLEHCGAWLHALCSQGLDMSLAP